MPIPVAVVHDRLGVDIREADYSRLSTLDDGIAPNPSLRVVRRLHRPIEIVDMEKIRIEQHTFSGTLWFAGWLFTIGYLHLTFWKGLLAVIVWPYYLGLVFAAVSH